MPTTRIPSVSQSGSAIYSGALRVYFRFFKVFSADQNDPIPIPGITTLKAAALIKVSDQSAVTCTIATNIVTVTQAISSTDLFGIAIGV